MKTSPGNVFYVILMIWPQNYHLPIYPKWNLMIFMASIFHFNLSYYPLMSSDQNLLTYPLLITLILTKIMFRQLIRNIMIYQNFLNFSLPYQVNHFLYFTSTQEVYQKILIIYRMFSLQLKQILI